MPFVIAALGDLLWAILSILLAVAIVLIIRALIATIPDVSVLGWSLHDALNTAGQYMAIYVTNETHVWWGRISDLIRAETWVNKQLFGGALTVLEYLGGQVAHLFNVVIPAAQTNAVASANNHSDSLATSLQNNIDKATNDEAHDVTSLQNNIDTLSNYVNGTFRTDIDNDINLAATGAVQVAEADANQLFDNLATRLQGDEALLSQIDGIVTYSLPAEIAAGVSSAEAQARSDLSSAVQTIEVQISQAETQLEAAIASGDAALQQQIGQSIDQLNTQLDTIVGKQQIDEANIGQVENLTSVVIPASIAAVATAVSAITTEFDTCAMTTCDGPNNWQNIIGGITNGATLAELVLFLEAAATDPKGEATAIASVADDLYNTGHGLVDALLSL